MKTSSKIAIAAGAIGAAWLLFKNKAKKVAGIGALGQGVKYLVRYTPKYHYSDFPLCWLNYEDGSANLQNAQEHATRFDTYEEAAEIAQMLFDDDYYYYKGSYSGYEIIEKLDHDEKKVQETIDWLLAHEESFRYRMLSRMKMDCDYYLGNGNRHGKYL